FLLNRTMPAATPSGSAIGKILKIFSSRIRRAFESSDSRKRIEPSHTQDDPDSHACCRNISQITFLFASGIFGLVIVSNGISRFSTVRPITFFSRYGLPWNESINAARSLFVYGGV